MPIDEVLLKLVDIESLHVACCTKLFYTVNFFTKAMYYCYFSYSDQNPLISMHDFNLSN